MYKVDLNYFINLAIVCDSSLKIIDANDKAVMSFGYSFEELTQMYFWELLKSKNRYHAWELFSFKGFETFYQEEFITADERTIIGSFAINKIVDTEGKEDFFVLIRDITEYLTMLEKLKKVNKLLRTLSSINQVILKKYELGAIFDKACYSFVYNAFFKFSVFYRIDNENSKLNFVVGYGDEYICKYFEQIENIEKLSADLPVFSKSLTHKGLSYENDLSQIEMSSESLQILLRQGTKSIICLPIRVDEKLFGIFILGINIPGFFDKDELVVLEEARNDIEFAVKDYFTERKLIEIERKRKIFFERSPAGFVIIDSKGRILDANPKFAEIVGIPKFDTINRQLASFFPLKKVGVDFEKIINSLTENKIQRFEFSFERDQKRFWLLGDIEYIEEFDFGFCVFYDITELKELGIKLEIETERAKESDRLKSHILQNISHEFRTPLSSILGFAQVIQQDSPVDSQTAEFAQIIYQSTKRLYRILEALIYTSQLVGGVVRVRPTYVEINELIKAVKKDLVFPDKQTNLEFEVKVDLENTIFCSDFELLRYLLFVLLDNALKFTSEGKIKLEVTEKQRDGHRFCEFKVIDTGIGLTSEAKEKIFEMFRQGSEGVARHYEGLGLGLFNAKLMVQLLGGEIEIESEEGEGTTVTVLLPELNCESI
jgi:PAS domain S-box-containing protein